MADEKFTLEQAKTLLRVQAGLAKNAEKPKCLTTLADLSSYFEEESKKSLAKAKFEDEIYELLLQNEPKLTATKPGRPSKDAVKVRQAALSALRRKAMCIADTVTRAEEETKREEARAARDY